MEARQITCYTDYKSPFAYLAKDPAYELEQDFGVRIEWLPFTLNIPSFLGAVETRSELEWRKVRYAYMDARRWANKRGLTVRGPQKIFDSSIALIGMLFALRQGQLRPYHDLVFERFWKRELDIEDSEVIRTVLGEAGVESERFRDFLGGEGRELHDRIIVEAEALGVFGVPTFVLEGELFWGHDRIVLVREKLEAA